MIRQRQEAIWPFLCILVCLFVLSATSPRAWDRAVRNESAASGKPSATVAGMRRVHFAVPAAPAEPGLSPAPRLVRSPRMVSVPTRSELAGASDAELGTEWIATFAARVAGRAKDLTLPDPLPADLPSHETETAPDEAVLVEERPSEPSAMNSEEPRLASIPDRSSRGESPSIGDVAVPDESGSVAASDQPDSAAWPEPVALTAQLEALASHEVVGPWATAVLAEIHRLGRAVCTASDEGPSILDRLAELGMQSDTLVTQVGSPSLRRRLRRVRFALHRRLDIWRLIVVAGGPYCPPFPQPEPDFQRLALAVADLDAMTTGSTEGRAWRRYLLLDALKEIHDHSSTDRQQQRMLARRILKRLAPRQLTRQQREFVATGPVAVLDTELRNLATDPVDLIELVRHVEAFEQTGLPSEAGLVAEDSQRLSFSASADHRELAERIESHYRNANLRIVLTEELMNRLMPERDPEYMWVNDTVLGSTVRGRSLTFTDVAVDLVPDSTRLRLALEVTGRVSSNTSATNGPATFYNRSEAVYVARKPMELGIDGIRMWPADVEVQNATRLRGLETDFDSIPIFGSLVQGFARSQHDAKRCQANREVERKVAYRAKRQIDNEADARMAKVSQRLREHIMAPLIAMSLGPKVIESRTTRDRMTMRLRLASDDQLGGNTPRPWAPSDSLASFQVHESAMNNVLQKLDLEGRTFTLVELRKRIASRLNQPKIAERKTKHDDVAITFADQDAVTVRFQDGRIILTLAIVEFFRDPHVWYDFKVRAFYRPEIDGQSARLVRDGVVHVIGQLDFRSQIGVRGVFGKTFSRDKPLDLTPERLSSDPRMADLAINQFVIGDGWISVALGPKQRSVPPEVARRLKRRMGPAY